MSAGRILVVEDEGIVSLDIQNRLRRAGYTIAGVASSGVEAINQATAAKPDLVLMDIKLQGQLDGIETARLIRDRLNVPVVYLTAYADEETLKRANLTAAFGYLLKPFKERELVATVEMALTRYKLEQQLKESEQWFSTTLTSIGDAVIATDEQGRIKFMNPLAETLTGWRQGAAVGLDADVVFRIIDANSRRVNPSPVREVLDTGKIVFLQNNTLLLARNGREIPIDDSAAPISNDRGELVGVVLIFRDVTERKQAEKILLQAHKMESLGVLAGGVAHDFNNLLVAILGQISLALARSPVDSEVSQHLEKAAQAAEQAAELTRQLLAYSGRGQFRRQPLSLNELVEKNRQLLEAAIPKGVRIDLDLADSLPLVDADPSQMQQVIMNLILNAAEAVGEQTGTITLRTGLQSIDRADVAYWRYTGEVLRPNHYVLLEVIDTGCGIPDDLTTDVFEPFFTTKRTGRGLGLSAVLGAVRGHGGGISLDSQPGNGTSFRLVFPISEHERPGLSFALREPEEPPVLAAPPPVVDTRVNRQKVLIIDDELFVQEAIADTLEMEGIEVMTASDALTGIAAYEAHKADIGLILLDLSMPGMGGAQAFHRLREMDPEVKVILLSGYDKQEVMHKDDWQGLTAFIQKPYELYLLIDVVQRQLHQASNPGQIS
jgi:two-component system, cell cycle sensor histidine kinase and response regulator CckA